MGKLPGMNRRRRAYRWICTVVFALSILTVGGQLAPVRAETESERFFDQGEQEFEQEKALTSNIPGNSGQLIRVC